MKTHLIHDIDVYTRNKKKFIKWSGEGAGLRKSVLTGVMYLHKPHPCSVILNFHFNGFFDPRFIFAQSWSCKRKKKGAPWYLHAYNYGGLEKFCWMVLILLLIVGWVKIYIYTTLNVSGSTHFIHSRVISVHAVYVFKDISLYTFWICFHKFKSK